MSAARLAAIALAAMLMTGAASDPSERLTDPAAEARARALFREFRCVVCQNESIDDSEADLAGDLRRIVREQVAAGRSDAQIRAFMTERYGDFVLLKPPLDIGNLALWLTPPLLLVGAGVALFMQARRRRGETAPLSDEEERRLSELLVDGEIDTIPPHKGQMKRLADDGKVT